MTQRPEDRHTLDAARIYGVPAAEVTPKMRAEVKAATFLERLEEGSREGLRLMRKRLGITDEEQKKLLADYCRAFPAARDLMKAKKL